MIETESLVLEKAKFSDWTDMYRTVTKTLKSGW